MSRFFLLGHCVSTLVQTIVVEGKGARGGGEGRRGGDVSVGIFVVVPYHHLVTNLEVISPSGFFSFVSSLHLQHSKSSPRMWAVGFALLCFPLECVKNYYGDPRAFYLLFFLCSKLTLVTPRARLPFARDGSVWFHHAR